MKTVDFSETIAASGLKVSRSRHLIEYMKVCEIFLRNCCANLNQISYESFQVQGNENLMA